MTAPRLITLTYGGRTIGDGTTNQPDGLQPMRIISSFETYTVELDFIVTASLSTEIAALEEDFRKRREDLTLTFGGSTRSFTKGAGTGFDSRAELVKRGDDADTGNTRLYTARVVMQLPADDESGLLELTEELGFDACRHATLTITGIYTRTPAGGSKAAYDADIAARQATAIANAGGGTFNLISEVTNTDRPEDSRTEFRRELLEVKFAESGGGLDLASIVNQQLSITRQDVAGESSPTLGGETIQPVIVGTANYEACVSFDVTTALESLFKGTILPWIASNIKDILGAATVCLVDVSPTYDLPNNRITAVVTYEALVPVGAERLIEFTQSTVRTLSAGKVLVPVWTKGSAFSKYIFQGPAREMLRVSTTERREGSAPAGFLGFKFQTERIDAETIAKGLIKDAEWVLMEDEENIMPIRRGLPGEACDITIVTRNVNYERSDTFARSEIEFG